MTDKAISPLRRRMLEDMAIRKLAPKTQASYLRAVRHFTAFLGRSPDQASAEDLRRYQLHLSAGGMSAPSLNATVTALRFFFHGDGAALLLHGDAGAARGDGTPAVRPPAPEVAGRLESG
jgi:site-specific recombinase XerC